ncbi:MAG: hypothetical protein AB7H97_00045 [Pseudobdellovibrionaceae bacterium]
MKKSKSLPGINIQYPISRLIVEGEKTVETRTYPIPDHYIGKEMVLIETPGSDNAFAARAIAVIIFEPSFKYASKAAFYADTKRHRVTPSSPWKWQPGKIKWGWPVKVVRVFSQPVTIQTPKGIRFTKEVRL